MRSVLDEWLDALDEEVVRRRAVFFQLQHDCQDQARLADNYYMRSWFRTPNEPEDGVLFLSGYQKVAWVILAALGIYVLLFR
ncbi:MAG TPA: hypothetical protein VGF24_32045 [Vicinamibacterales bacterium]